jgi:hypothetical protein
LYSEFTDPPDRFEPVDRWSYEAAG